MVSIASILEGSPHLKAIVESAQAVLSGIDLSPLLMYLIDTTSPEALPYLAEQFGVLGYGGFIITENEQQQRDLLKKALELQRYKGTVWAIKESLKAVGYGEPEIIEGVGGFEAVYDGSFTYDGSITYQPSSYYDWATFSVVFDLADGKGITTASTETLVKVVGEYKNARSRLIGVSFKANLSDTLLIDDDGLSYAQGDPFTELFKGVRYDGTAFYDGSITYSGQVSDEVELQVINTQGNTILVDKF